MKILGFSRTKVSFEFEDTERKFFGKLLVLLDNMLAVSHLSVEEYAAVFGDEAEAVIEPFRARGQNVVLEYTAEEVDVLKRAINVALNSSYFEGRFKLLLGLSEHQAELLLDQMDEAVTRHAS